jgi:hypothetical protein
LPWKEMSYQRERFSRKTFDGARSRSYKIDSVRMVWEIYLLEKLSTQRYPKENVSATVLSRDITAKQKRLTLRHLR